MHFKKLGVCSDHAGTELKQMILDFIKLIEVDAIDYGVAHGANTSVDYPDYAELVAKDILVGKIDGGIAICGTGIGMCITANKIPGVRAASAWDEYSARMSRAHNDANVICLGARTLNYHRAVDVVKTWLETPFEGDRHQLRVNKIREIEKKFFKPW
ncbi:MAG: ribose 5-phosphate isomerase B [Bdellovibrionota bacterium]